MKLSGPKATIARARVLRKAMSKAERLLWWALRRQQIGYKFRHQHPAGPYVLDFYCDGVGLCVEVDGESHELRVAHDQARDAYLARLGVSTLRIAAHDVVGNLDGVVQLIAIEAKRREAALGVRAPSGASRRLPRRGRS